MEIIDQKISSKDKTMIDRFKQFIKGSKKSIIDGQIDETIMDHFNDIIDEFNMEPRIYRRLMEDKNMISI